MMKTTMNSTKSSIDEVKANSTANPDKSIVSSGLPNIMLPNIRSCSTYHRGDSPRCTTTTDETSSDGAFSRVSSDNGQQYEVIEYDYDRDANLLAEPAEIFADVVGKTAVITIDEDSPAAEALRANARIYVSSVSKAARAVQLQSVRRAFKRATGITKSGHRKGKPPRIPPTLMQSSNLVVTAGPGDVDVHAGAAIAKDTPAHTIRENEEEEDESIATANHVVCHADPHLDDSSMSQGGEMDESHSGVLKPSYIPKGSQPPEKVVDRETMHIPDGVAPGTVEAGKKVLRSVDPYDLLRVVRWKRKKSGELKKKKSYVKGKVIDGEHELYTLSIAVMIGVRTSISRTNTELNSLKPPLKRWVRPSDFRTTEKYEFHPKGDGPLLPPHQLAHTFKFKDYCPVVFAYLRRMHGVNEFDFLLSVCGNANFIEFISNAKSGQFFFYSGDGRYMIKTMTNSESKFLRQILPEYFKHCCENPNTMITRFFGMYRVKLYHLRRNVKFVIMNSVYYTDKNLQTFYDLKGSSVGRDAKPHHAVLKDNDLRRSLPDNALALRPQQRALIRDQLVADCAFLTKMGVMDYSMLVGIHYVPQFEGRTSITHKKTGRGLPVGAVRKRNTVGSSSNYGNHDHSETTSDSEPAVIRQMSPIAPDSPVLKSPTFAQQKAVPLESLCASLPTNSSASKSPMRPSAVCGASRGRSDTTLTMAALLEEGLEDDDNSYLHGSSNRPLTVSSVNEETERKKQATVEKLFWPFHNLYDIHGHRRLNPVTCITCNDAPCSCEHIDSALLEGYNIPKFVAPLSDRKDGGYEMDTTGLQLPCKMKGLHNCDVMFDGKIFYMGVIDILQEYNTRKEIESVYRIMQSSSKTAASCVPPPAYSRRFIEFFDQYTQRSPKVDLVEQGQEVNFKA